jgi:DMSO reductase family type II enzyme molybdopterin subunit
MSETGQSADANSAGVSSLALDLHKLAPGDPDVAAPASPSPITFDESQDVWRDAWSWDRVVHSSHSGSNCLGACSFNVFIREGIAWYEEPNAIYEASEPGVPDSNPRGCPMGACYTHLMYEPSRVLHPLRRTGERGSGQWKRVSWDAALEEIADRMLDAAVEQGTGSILFDAGSADAGPDSTGFSRTIGLLGSTMIESMAGIGDMPMGACQTLGMYDIEGTSDDWFKSDFIVVWLGNPAYTRVPEMHYMLEARYRGAKFAVVAPDYSASSIHADYWLNPRGATDAALALAMAQVILSEGLHDEAHIREQTDLPILVREDTGRYLRAADLEAGGKQDLLYFWDEAAGSLAEVPGCQGHEQDSVALGEVRPALAGCYPVQLADGTTVPVVPLLERLRAHLDADYTPEQAAAITGVGAGTIRRIARELATASAAMIFSGWGACKHYHSDLIQRAQILLMALTGNQGKSGGGYRIASWWPLTASTPGIPQRWLEYEQMLQTVTQFSGLTPLMPFLYVHAGYSAIWDRPELHDPLLPRSTAEYMKESLEKGWIPIRPQPGTEPRVLLFRAGNPLRRWPAPQVAKESFWPRLGLIVDINMRVSTSGLYSDLILPTAGYYERDALKYPQSYLPYLVLCEKAVEPLGEAKPEWEIFGLLARKIQERARARGVTKVRNAIGAEVDLSTFYEQWSEGGKSDERDPRAALDVVLRNCTTTGGIGYDEASRTGLLPIVEVSDEPNAIYATGTEYKKGRTLYPHARFIEKKHAWPTYSGRQQFLIDHPWFEEVGEMLPVHKEPPPAGGDYPLRLSGGHTRWSMHAKWRDSALMLRLQRGGPAVWVAKPDADARGVADGDRIRVFNDAGAFEAIAKVAPAVQPGQVIAYHAWEHYQFKDWKGQQEPVLAPWKPLHLAGGYAQLHYRFLYGAPGHSPRAQCIDFAKA